jgi:hypothetical protein
MAKAVSSFQRLDASQALDPPSLAAYASKFRAATDVLQDHFWLR